MIQAKNELPPGLCQFRQGGEDDIQVVGNAIQGFFDVDQIKFARKMFSQTTEIPNVNGVRRDRPQILQIFFFRYGGGNSRMSPKFVPKRVFDL